MLKRIDRVMADLYKRYQSYAYSAEVTFSGLPPGREGYEIAYENILLFHKDGLPRLLVDRRRPEAFADQSPPVLLVPDVNDPKFGWQRYKGQKFSGLVFIPPRTGKRLRRCPALIGAIDDAFAAASPYNLSYRLFPVADDESFHRAVSGMTRELNNLPDWLMTGEIPDYIFSNREQAERFSH